MRLWVYRIHARPPFWRPGERSSEYMELDFRTRREAHLFAFDLLDDPTIHKVVCTDSAGRAEPLILGTRHADQNLTRRHTGTWELRGELTTGDSPVGVSGSNSRRVAA